MKSIFKLMLVMLFVVSSIIGCDGCFDDAVTNKVDAPNFTFVRGTNYTVKMSSDTRAAKIKYTTDGTDPKTSETAVEGTEVEIDFFTTIKAYAYKEGKRESVTLTFGLPNLTSARKVRYNSADNAVYDHIYFANDPNDKRKVVKYYNGKGDDDQWFTGDDTINYYILYVYDGDNLSKEYKYTGSGDDGKWFTSDDTYEYVSTFTIEEGKIKEESVADDGDSEIASATYSYDADDNLTIDTSGSYPEKDINIYEGGYGSVVGDLTYTGSYTASYDYTYEGKDKRELVIGSTTWKYNRNADDTDYTDLNKEYVYEYTTDDKGQAVKKVKKLGYGSDTDWGYTDQTFDENGNILTATLFWDNAGEKSRAYYEYEYADNLLTKVTKYKSTDKVKVRYWKEIEYDNSKKKVVNYYNRDEEKEKYEEYTWDSVSYYLTKQRPDVASHEFVVAIATQATEIQSGSYTVSGYEFDHNGDPVSAIVDDTDDLDKLAKNTADKIKYIVDNTDFGKNSLTIHGKEEGECQILISTYGDSVNVVFDFNEYNDGDVIIDGILDFEVTATVDVSGNLSGSGEGFIDGEVYVADANPGITDADYITIAATQIFTNADDVVVQEIEYKTAGPDGDWLTFNDNKTKYVRKYQYTDGKLMMKAQFKGEGDDKAWDLTDAIETSDDRVGYKVVYEYDGSAVKTETCWREYGLHGQKSTADDPDESLKFYLGWRLWWDIDQRFEIDWDDDYWHEDEDDEDRLVWSVEDAE